MCRLLKQPSSDHVDVKVVVVLPVVSENADDDD